ncbi:MAG: hypothetical protein H6606_11450 [Flavobacteriales bacterium]|nr:hypothetical protein [Flavobacteriales bacterium]
MKVESQTFKDLDLFSDEVEAAHIQRTFKEIFELFIQANYPDDKDTLMCSIHESFNDDGHNCVACNLESNVQLAVNFLKSHRSFTSPDAVFASYIWHLYMLTTRIEEYLDILQIPESARNRKFKVFGVIRRWTNFVKHPKAFMFVHHPVYAFKNTPTELDFKIIDPTEFEIVIDDEFVKEFYTNGTKNSKLHGRLNKKEGVLVQFPDPLEMIKEFIEAQKNFVNLIANNEMVREILEEKATRYYENK